MGESTAQSRSRTTQEPINIFSSLSSSSLLSYIYYHIILKDFSLDFCNKDTSNISTYFGQTKTMTESKILTEETVPQYINDHASDLNIFSPESTLTATPILGGNVNYAFYITDETGERSVFLKQAPEFVAIFGPDGLPLTSQRMKREMDVYEEWRVILGEELGSKYLPELYKFDAKWMVCIMEFLKGYTLLDHVLVDSGIVPLPISTGLGEFMGKVHAASHCSIVSKDRASFLTEQFENREMRDIQLEYVFTKAYKEATEEQKAGLIVDDVFMKEIEDLKKAYDGKGSEDNLCLCHGDLHPGSVMADAEIGSVKVIDPEFTVYGPPGLDVGSLLSGYVLAAVHQAYSGNNDAVISVCDGAKAVWKKYQAEMEAGGIDEKMLKRIEVESVGFTVAEVCRTALEFAGGRKWLQFEDLEVKKKSRKAALKIVQNCIVHRHEGGMQLLFSEMSTLAESK